MLTPEWVSVEEAAEIADCSVATMRRWAKHGRVKAQKLGKGWIIERATVPARRGRRTASASSAAGLLDFDVTLRHVRNEDLRNPWVPDVLGWRDVIDFPALTIRAAEEIIAGTRPIEAPIAVDVPKTAFFTRNGQMLPMPEAVAYHGLVASFADRAEKRRRPCVFSARRAAEPTKRLLEEGTALWKQWAAHVVERIRAGNEYMMSTDITAYYDCIPHSLLLAEVEAYVDDAAVVAQLRRMLGEWGAAQVGIPQGPDASRLLGNIYLYPVDEAMDNDPRWEYTRYMDDIRIVSRSRKALRAALRLLERECKRRRLVLSAQKTELLVGTAAIDDFEDPSLNSAQALIRFGRTRRARQALRKILDKALKEEGDINVRHARFSLYRLWMSRDRLRLYKVLENLEYLGPVAKHAVTYIRPWLDNARVKEYITLFLADDERNESPFIEAWLYALLVETPGEVPPSWVGRARQLSQDGNAPDYLRGMAMNLCGHAGVPTDVATLEREATHARHPYLARAALVALARAGRLKTHVAKKAVARHPDLETTITYLRGRNNLPSLIYADRVVPIPT